MKDNILTKLYENHNKWNVIVKRLGAPNHVAEDLVMDMYIKMHNVNKNTVIKSIDVYAYFVLRNLYFDYFKKQNVKRSKEVSIEELTNRLSCTDDKMIYELEDSNLFCMKSEIVESKKIDDLELAKNTLIWYDRKVLDLHYSGLTMRKISRDTGISLSSIFNTIKNARKTIREYLDNEE